MCIADLCNLQRLLVVLREASQACRCSRCQKWSKPKGWATDRAFARNQMLLSQWLRRLRRQGAERSVSLTPPEVTAQSKATTLSFVPLRELEDLLSHLPITYDTPSTSSCHPPWSMECHLDATMDTGQENARKIDQFRIAKRNPASCFLLTRECSVAAEASSRHATDPPNQGSSAPMVSMTPSNLRVRPSIDPIVTPT